MAAGKVWLVGAGPGDIGLFTLKGAAVLQQADVVVYDSLVGEGVLAKIPEHARLINVGKRANHHTMVQEDINKVLLEEAEKGNKVVRLKGGDPFLFGRGGEELELLSENGIPYEIVPGVTSPISVPAYNGIPVTHRDFCSSLHIITGHKRAGQEYDIDFKALTQTKGTLVFLMGIAALEDICKGLLAGGMDPDMPAAVLQKGTTAGQKRVVATVGTLKEEVDRQGIETPAIMLWERYVLWLTNLPGTRNFLWQAGRFWSQDQDSIFQRQQIFSVRKVPRFWSCRLSVQYLLRIMADCMRHLRNWILISGSFLQALQVWRSFLTRWTEKRWMCAAWDRRRSQ